MKIACFPLRKFLLFILDLETLNINKSESVLTGLLQKINQDHLSRFGHTMNKAIACREINPSIKLENQLAENEYLLLRLPLFYALPLQ